jgi:ribosome-associated toxin RatA of RatAB toxin-antitoxin module
MIPPDDSKGINIDNQQIWTVEAKSIQSKLFDSLKSRWKLSLIEDEGCTGASCNVNFDVEIQVSNPLISFTLDRVLKDVAGKQVDAFEKRCRSIPFVGGAG